MLFRKASRVKIFIDGEDIQVAFREDAPTINHLKQVAHLKGILPDVPYDKNEVYNQG